MAKHIPSIKKSTSIPEFCDENGLSRSFFYTLLKRGLAPKIMKIGRRTLITVEAADEWRKKMTEASNKNKEVQAT